jgi:hypothetical protein
LLLFIIPIGSGIPGGVVLAHQHGFTWPIMLFLYFISDVLLALCFEPLLLFFVNYSKRTNRFARLREAMAQSMKKTLPHYGINPGPFSLIMITFGTDPMTGRSVAFAAGHGFLSGWALTIIGDLMFFSVIMISTLWLNDILGNGTQAALIIMVAMIGVPMVVKAVRKRFFNASGPKEKTQI